MTRTHLAAAALLSSAAVVAFGVPAGAASTSQTLSKSFNYTCAVTAGGSSLGNFTIGVGANVVVPTAVYPAQTIPSRTVKIALTLPEALRAATTGLLKGDSVSGSSTNAYVTATSNKVTQTYKIPKLSAPSAKIPGASPWVINASGTVPAMKTAASAKTSAVIGMPSKFTVNAVVNAGSDSPTGSPNIPVIMACTGPSDKTLGSITVKPDKVPTAAAIKVSTKKNKAVTVTLKGADGDGDKLTYAVGKAKHGTVTLKGNKATYTPKKNYTGKDAFNYSVSDGKADPVKAAVSITVTK